MCIVKPARRESKDLHLSVASRSARAKDLNLLADSPEMLQNLEHQESDLFAEHYDQQAPLSKVRGGSHRRCNFFA